MKKKVEKNHYTKNDLAEFSNIKSEELLKKHSINGLNSEQIEESQEEYGENKITDKKQKSLFFRIIHCFIEPFCLVLIALGIFTLVTDLLIPNGDGDPTAVIIIFSMVLISGILRFIQESKSNNSASKLKEFVETTTLIERESIQTEIPLDEVVCFDIVHLRSGDIIPADARILYAKDFFIAQSALTGESEPVEKRSELSSQKYDSLLSRENLIFMGSTVVSGYAIALVIAVGDNTYFGEIAVKLSEKSPLTSFEKGIKSVSFFLLRVMLVVVPLILIINGVIKGDWMEALFFAISIAVGLTPEMLPTIVTISLSTGAIRMAKKKVIVKNINAIQNFGAMDILCTDKTGTLTQDHITVEKHFDVDGNDSHRILRHAFLNSYFQTGLKNLLDKSIITKMKEASEIETEGLIKKYTKIDEIPFDFERRRLSVLIKDENDKTQMITKGAIEEMLTICSFVQTEDQVIPLDEQMVKKVLKKVEHYNDLGYRVIAVAQKTNPADIDVFSVEDESNMVLIGFLSFFDPPKESTKEALETISKYGVAIKVLTGDNEKTTQAICKMVGISVDKILLGTDIANMDDETLIVESRKTQVFAKLSPHDKARIVNALKAGGHTVGFMGDGINDAPALKVADVSISVDTATDIAKESANIILLEKDLNVLTDGIIEGRITFANMMKYIGITVSSNFGNIFAILIASIFIPFLPMLAIHLLLLNLIYDITCITLPFDRVDPKYLLVPRKINPKQIFRFMVAFGPISTVFDITTFVMMYFVLCPLALGGNYHDLTPDKQVTFIAMFRAGWFIVSMWSQTLVLFFLRTKNIIKDRPALPVIITLIVGIVSLTIIPFTPFGLSIDLVPLQPMYFVMLGVTIILYILLVIIVKKLYLKKFHELI